MHNRIWHFACSRCDRLIRRAGDPIGPATQITFVYDKAALGRGIAFHSVKNTCGMNEYGRRGHEYEYPYRSHLRPLPQDKRSESGQGTITYNIALSFPPIAGAPPWCIS
jgi:hypothetical protein